MRIVVDTNVIVAGVLSPNGPPGLVLELCLAAAFTLLVDDRILAEYHEVLARPRFGLAARDVEEILIAIGIAAERVPARPLGAVLPDPHDRPFLEVAASGQADWLITGNLRHFPSRALPQGVRVITPRGFIDRVIGEERSF